MQRVKGTNIIHSTYEKLIKLGYKKREKNAKIGDLLCGTNEAKDVWIEIDDKKTANLDCKKFLILGK